MSAADAEDAVLYETTASGVAILTFNRPDRLNAWGPDIAAGFYAAIAQTDRAMGHRLSLAAPSRHSSAVEQLFRKQRSESANIGLGPRNHDP